MQAKPWTKTEDAALRGAFEVNKKTKDPDAAIFKSKVLNGRTQNAIRVRRSKIGAVLYVSPKINYPEHIGAQARKGHRPPEGTALTLDLKESAAPTNGTHKTDEQILRGLPVTIKETQNNLAEKGPAGVFVFYSFGNTFDYQARGLAPRQVARILAQIIQKLV